MASVRFQEKRISESVVEFTATREFALLPTTATLVSVALVMVSTYCMMPLLLWALAIVFLVSLVIYIAVNEVQEESILIARDFGVQLHRKYITGTVETNFLDRDKIRSVILHEYVKYTGVYFCLAFVVDSSSKLAVCFTDAYPGLECVRRVCDNCVMPQNVPHSKGPSGGSKRYQHHDTPVLSSN